MIVIKISDINFIAENKALYSRSHFRSNLLSFDTFSKFEMTCLNIQR